jgi:WD40 repeat protein
MDYTCRVWDATRNVKCVQLLDVKAVLQPDEGSMSLNPPFVMCLALRHPYLVCGLGDGSLQLYEYVGKRKVGEWKLAGVSTDHHAHQVVSVHFGGVIVSASTDSQIHVYQVPTLTLVKTLSCKPQLDKLNSITVVSWDSLRVVACGIPPQTRPNALHTFTVE